MDPSPRTLFALGVALALLLGGCGGGHSGDQTGAAGGERGPWFRSERSPTSIADTQEEVTAYRVGERGTVSCGTGTYGARLKARSETLSMHLAYRDCQSNGGTARVDTAGCVYVLKAAAPEEAAPARISCPDREKIEISLPGGCRLEIGSQTPRGGVAYASTGKGRKRSFDANAELTGVTYETSAASGCAAVGNGRDAAISFGIELYGSEVRPGGDGDRVGLWVE